MRRFLFLLALILPVLDILATNAFAQRINGSVWWLFAAGAIVGVLLIRKERQHFRARFMSALTAAASQDPNPWRGVIDSGRKVVAGILFLVPGLLSDMSALVLLLVPINVAARLIPAWATSTMRSTAQPHRAQTYDAPFRRVE